MDGMKSKRKTMTEKEIRECQKKYEEYLEENITNMQEWIDTGLAWQFEGSVGRTAMSFLECGACFLPTTPFWDAYKINKFPSREWLKPGTTGTLENSTEFWSTIKEDYEKENPTEK